MSKVVCYCLSSYVNNIQIHHLKTYFTLRVDYIASQAAPRYCQIKQLAGITSAHQQTQWYLAFVKLESSKNDLANSAKVFVDNMGSIQK